MMSICLMYTKNDNDAVEVMNQGFLKIFLHIGRYSSELGSLYTWMRTVMVHCCIDFLKIRNRTEQHNELIRAVEIYIDAEAIHKLDASALLEMVRHLTPATQSVFQLYVIEGYNHREIGKLLGISEGTSKWHLSEARKNLQQMIRMSEVHI